MFALFSKFTCGSAAISQDKLERRQQECVPCFEGIDIRKDYELKDVLGVPGTFGEVRKAIHRRSGQEFAVKIMKVSHYLEHSVRTECDILRRISHLNVCHAECVYSMKKHVYIVMEKYEGGDLFDVVMSKGGKCTEDFTKKVIRQVLKGLEYLHQSGIAHCDVKLSNIMFDHGIVKLIDFGVSQIVSEEGLHAEVGSPSFIAPEVLMGSYTEICDMWSLGVVVFILLFGFNPFNPRALPALQMRARICEAVLRGFTPIVRKGYGAFFPECIPVSEDARDFIAHLLTLDWKTRMTSSEALQHPWLAI